MKGTPDFPQCGFSAQAVAALKQLGTTFHAVNIFEDLELRDELKRFSNWPTYPQLYVKGELVVGGFGQLHAGRLILRWFWLNVMLWSMAIFNRMEAELGS
jgi:glutaredoxin